MSYRIDYTGFPETTPTYGMHPLRTALLILVVLTVFISAVHISYPEGMEILQKLIFPGDAPSTRQTLNLLVDDLRAGIPFSEAAQAFCREIIANADIP